MRKVKCRVTGEYGYDCVFFKADNGKYYKTKEVYEDWLKQKEYKTKIFHLVNSKILNKRQDNCGGLIGKLINESGLEPKVLYESIVEQFDYINEIVKNSKENDSSKIYAVFAIATKRLNKVTYAGCYEIKNNETNEIYIGESVDLFGRFTSHIAELYENKHHCVKLQEAFNRIKSISNFTITPLFMFPISSIDKNELKHETLYLETAFYLICKSNNQKLYNTQNPYAMLKNNNVTLSGYEIDCNKVLHLLINDKYKILSKELLERVKDNLQKTGIVFPIESKTRESETKEESEILNAPLTEKLKCGNCDDNNMTDIEKQRILFTSQQIDKGVKLYRISNLLKEFVQNNILPENYDYSTIRDILVENNLISINENRYTVATDYALDNGLYYLSNVHTRSGKTIYNYYVSEKCKELLVDLFSHSKRLKTFNKPSQTNGE